MLTDSVRRKVWKVASSYYSDKDWAHGRQHVERVVKMATEIARREDADLTIVELAAILHDIFAAREPRSRDKTFRHDIQGAKEAREVLSKLGFDGGTIEAVSHCIEAHRKRSSTEPRTIEAKCLFDGDKLDAIGAIGVIRSAFIAFEHGQEFYRDEKDIEAYNRMNIGSDGRAIDFAKHSSNLEYELSLKWIAGRMYTRTGRELAKGRAAFMHEFYCRIGKELKGAV